MTFKREEARDTQALIDGAAIRHNYRVITETVGETYCVIKANAYGHGAEICARELRRAGASRFAVATLEEALEIKAAINEAEGSQEGAEILILGYTSPVQAAILEENGISATAVSLSHLEEFAKTGKKLSVHLAVDTGMNRIGISVGNGGEAASAAAKRAAEIFADSALIAAGVFTHFSRADGHTDADLEFTRGQYRIFCEFIEQARINGLSFTTRHACNSAAAVRFPEMHLDACRCGLILYGMTPDSAEEENENALYPRLRPVMRLKTNVATLHTAEAGERVGYGGSHLCERRTVIATLPIGYGDGFLRAYAKGCTPTVGGFDAPILGRICMDMCMIDVTDALAAGVPVTPGSEVTLLSAKNGGIDAVANAASTINYEITTAITKRVPRVLV